MMESLHREEFPLESVMRLIQQGAGRRHLGVFEHRIPAGLLVLKLPSDAFPVDCPSRRGDVVDKMTQSLAQCKHAQVLPLAYPTQ
jgi:hypothetical protein